MAQKPSRPVGITILAVLEILMGIVGLLASLVIIGFSALFATLPTVGPLVGAIGLVIGGVVLFFSIIWLATGVGFLHGRGWSSTLASSGSSSGGKAPVCPYCHSALPMGTKKCLTCGAAI